MGSLNLIVGTDKSRRKQQFTKNRNSSGSSTSSMSQISSQKMNLILDSLQLHQSRDSTKQNYCSIWQQFNNFLVRLDWKPSTWENRAAMFGAYLVSTCGIQSSTLQSYISAIKYSLRLIHYKWNDNKVILSSIIRACQLKNDVIKTRLPIQFALFEMLLFEIGCQFHHQPYLCHMYRVMFTLAYYGLMRIGEIAAGQHSLKACNVHIGSNKNKILLLLYMSKTHDEGSPPQKIKIMQEEEWNRRKKNFCPFELTRKYIKHRGDYRTDHEPFFIYRNSIPVPPATVHSVL